MKMHHIIKLTDFGLEALNNKLKYKYFFANAELLENQTATVDKINFSFKESFNLENEITLFNNNEQTILFDNPEILQKLQFQLFENDIYKGDIIELLENNTKINFRNITLQCEINSINNSLEINILKEGLRRPYLIDEINNF